MAFAAALEHPFWLAMMVDCLFLYPDERVVVWDVS